jgi:hypothetical protein
MLWCSKLPQRFGFDLPDALAGDVEFLTDFFEGVLALAADRIQLALVKGLLEDAGIPFFALGQIATQDVDPFLHKVVRVQVPRDGEVAARELLEQFFAAETSPQLAGEGEAEYPRTYSPPRASMVRRRLADPHRREY